MSHSQRPIDRSERAVPEPERQVVTLAERLVYLPTVEQRHNLERFRLKYEREHGPTQVTRSFTSLLPSRAQQELFDRDVLEWYRGLPEFAREFLKDRAEAAFNSEQLRPGEHNLGDFIRAYMGGTVCLQEDAVRGR